MRNVLFICLVLAAGIFTLAGTALLLAPDGNLLDMPLSLLAGTPFRNYLVPGVLTLAIGSLNLLAIFYQIDRQKYRYELAIAGAVGVMGWIAGQFVFLEFFHWSQLVIGFISLLILLIAVQLKGKWLV